MPIYDFQCTSCGHQSEVMRKMSESSTTTCPQCNVEAFTKMLSAPSFQLSGTGWYASDFKDKKPKNNESVDQKSTEKADVKTTEADTKSVACNTGCACH